MADSGSPAPSAGAVGAGQVAARDERVAGSGELRRNALSALVSVRARRDRAALIPVPGEISEPVAMDGDGSRSPPHAWPTVAARQSDRLGLSNSKPEGLNSKIRLINHRGYGYHSATAVIAMIYRCCGGITVTLPTER